MCCLYPCAVIVCFAQLRLRSQLCSILRSGQIVSNGNVNECEFTCTDIDVHLLHANATTLKLSRASRDPHACRSAWLPQSTSISILRSQRTSATSHRGSTPIAIMSGRRGGNRIRGPQSALTDFLAVCGVDPFVLRRGANVGRRPTTSPPRRSEMTTSAVVDNRPRLMRVRALPTSSRSLLRLRPPQPRPLRTRKRRKFGRRSESARRRKL